MRLTLCESLHFGRLVTSRYGYRQIERVLLAGPNYSLSHPHVVRPVFLSHHISFSLCPDLQKEGLVLFLSRIKQCKECNYCIPHAEVLIMPGCVICTIALPVSKQHGFLNPAASASNKMVVEYLATVSLELELANGSVCKACFPKLEKAMTYLPTPENITNKLQEKFALPPIRFVKLETVDICTASCARLPTSSHIITRSAI